MASRLSQAIDRVDDLQRRRPWLAFGVAVVRKMSDDRGGDLAALIAYYGFLSLFPLLLVFAAVLGFVLDSDPSLRAHVLTSAENSFPTLSGMLGRSVTGNGLALGVGTLGALWAGLGVTRAFERAMNVVWDVPKSERMNLGRSTLRGVVMLLSLGVLVVVSTALTGIELAPAVPSAIGAAIGVIGALGVNATLYYLAFELLSYRRLGVAVTWPGVVAGALGWTALQSVGTLYIGHVASHASRYYGPFAAVIALLAWIYLGAQLTLYCAQINVVRAEHLWPRSLRGEPTDADARAFARRDRVRRRG